MTIVVFICLDLVVLVMNIGEKKRMEIIVTDIGQGDGILIYNEDGELLLVDGGPTNEFVGMGFLQLPSFECGVSRILLTHPHTDHLFGLNRAMELCQTSLVYYNDIQAFVSGNFSRFKGLARLYNEQKLTQGDKISFGSFTIYILWPSPEYLATIKESTVNEASIAMLLDYRDFEMLFTGDINSDTQKRLKLSDYSYVIDDAVDVYKVPHHGSEHSFDEDFLAWLRPKAAIISVGENSYGHPSEKFINYFKKESVRLFRTDLDGDVRIKIR